MAALAAACSSSVRATEAQNDASLDVSVGSDTADAQPGDTRLEDATADASPDVTTDAPAGPGAVVQVAVGVTHS